MVKIWFFKVTRSKLTLAHHVRWGCWCFGARHSSITYSFFLSLRLSGVVVKEHTLRKCVQSKGVSLNPTMQEKIVICQRWQNVYGCGIWSGGGDIYVKVCFCIFAVSEYQNSPPQLLENDKYNSDTCSGWSLIFPRVKQYKTIHDELTTYLLYE